MSVNLDDLMAEAPGWMRQTLAGAFLNYVALPFHVEQWAARPTAQQPFENFAPSYAGTPIGRMTAEDAARLLGWIR